MSMPDADTTPGSATTHNKQTRDLLAWITEEASYRPSKLRDMARLFAKNKLRDRAQQIQTDQIKWAIDLVRNWQDDINAYRFSIAPLPQRHGDLPAQNLTRPHLDADRAQ